MAAAVIPRARRMQAMYHEARKASVLTIFSYLTDSA